MVQYQVLQDLLRNPKVLIPIVVWCMIWKGISLWKCGRNNQLYWFIALLVINTLGLLEIIYLLGFQKKRK